MKAFKEAETHFKAALSAAQRVKCSPGEYVAALESFVEELEHWIEAAKEDVKRNARADEADE